MHKTTPMTKSSPFQDVSHAGIQKTCQKRDKQGRRGLRGSLRYSNLQFSYGLPGLLMLTLTSPYSYLVTVLPDQDLTWVILNHLPGLCSPLCFSHSHFFQEFFHSVLDWLTPSWSLELTQPSSPLTAHSDLGAHPPKDHQCSPYTFSFLYLST